MQRIRLPSGTWSYDPANPLGPAGGFGAVFRGSDSDGKPVAVKRLHVDAQQAAHRELAMARDLVSQSLPHIMPVLDAGQDADSQGYYVVMPIADGSLQDRLRKGPFGEPESIQTLLAIVDGLQSVAHIVHRDLKPGNVLRFQDRWCIADFGIARFVEDSTSAMTLKDCLSPPYAAPEQWRLERSTSATDAYALGCIGYALLTGSPPFSGTPDQLQEQHLRSAPPELPNLSPQLKTLLSMLLRKPAEARPALARVRAILESIPKINTHGAADPNLARLASAAAQHEKDKAQAHAEEEQRKAVARRRSELAEAARATLLQAFKELARRVSESVPNASTESKGSSHVIRVGSATLELDLGSHSPTYSVSDFPRSKWDVICGAVMEVVQARPAHKRAASLWYTRQEHPNAPYRWFEVGYEGNPLTGKGFEFQPAAVTPDLADRAHWHGMDVIQASYPPIAVDDENIDAFCRRWAHILAEACNGRLQHLPNHLPPIP